MLDFFVREHVQYQQSSGCDAHETESTAAVPHSQYIYEIFCVLAYGTQLLQRVFINALPPWPLQGPIRDAELLTADAFGAAKTWLLANGR